ncbi:MAG: D-alanine--D-alanine ligase [Ruminococcaceae bacterium]|nr:D-alanine--D-alanine ligase [Oscillospiraceae bacterium]
MKIVVLAGGLSTERDVSITSGKQVFAALKSKGHKVILLDVFMGYEEKLDSIDALFENGYDFTKSITGVSTQIPDLEEIKAMRKDKSDCIFGENVIDICKSADICFLALHGGVGENGQLQAALDMLGIKYTGAGYLGSAIAMDKGVTKAVFLHGDVPTPMSKLYQKHALSNGELKSWVDFPCVVKPCSAGSSVGVSIVQTKDDFEKAMIDAFKYEGQVLVEQYIKGREFSIGVLGNKALPIIEIIPKTGFYDYVNKYQAGNTEEICPAVLDDATTKKLQNAALHAFSELHLESYARIDFLLDDKGNIFCLEANTLPGMTPISLLPQEAKADGIDFPELCEKIVELSLLKYN